MPYFDSASAYWQFADSVAKEARYFHTEKTRDFLRCLSEAASERRVQLDRGAVLWRAQLGQVWVPFFDDHGNEISEEPGPHPPERMKPLPGSAKEGRANPKGIPCLYVADRRDTSLCEVRPWIGVPISIAQFRLKRAVQIVNCASSRPGKIYVLSDPPPEERDEVVWWRIDQAFSRPVTLSDSSPNYVPTQIVAEMFKAEGLDGLAYRSAFAGGLNIALFDIDCAEQLNCSLFEARDVSFDFRETCNPYFLNTVDADDEPSDDAADTAEPH